MRTIRMSLSRRKPFLRTLDKRSGTATDSPEGNANCGPACMVRGPMTEAAADMLRAYREVPTAQLALSGYLDIKETCGAPSCATDAVGSIW